MIRYSIREEEKPRENGRWKKYYIVYRDAVRIGTFNTRASARAGIARLKADNARAKESP